MPGVDPYLEQRRSMVSEQIRGRGLHDERVLRVMEEVPRELFVGVDASSPDAFSDKALPIACNQTISQPFMVAAMTSALDVHSRHRVLEVGTGSGYQTAVLSRLAEVVYTIERFAPLLDTARQRLHRVGADNVEYRIGDGTLGWPEAAPFDRILVTAGGPDVPPSLLNQLVEGGRLVMPVGDESEQVLTIIERCGRRFIETPQFPCRFVKLVGREGWREPAMPAR